jgi:hypothetical protein
MVTEGHRSANVFRVAARSAPKSSRVRAKTPAIFSIRFSWENLASSCSSVKSNPAIAISGGTVRSSLKIAAPLVK